MIPRKLGARAWALVIALVPLSSSAPVAATDPPEGEEEPRPSFTQTIEVTATGPELAVEERIPGESLEEGDVQDLAAALRREPGLGAARRGGVNLDPQVRGLSESQVAVLVDGTRTFAAGPARMDSDLSHVSPHAVETLRVVKGPYALAWGAGALSAVAVETFRPTFRADGFATGGRAILRYGENGGTRDGHALLGGGGERLSFSIFAGARVGDDYEDGDGVTVPADFESGEARWSLGYRPRENLLLDYRGGYQEQHDIDYPGRLLDATYFYTRFHSLDVDWQGAGTGVTGAFLQVYANHKDHRMNNDEKPTARPASGRVPPFALDVDLPTTSDTEGARFHLALAGGNLSWKLGGDLHRLEQSARRSISRRDTGALIFQDIVWPDAEIDNLGLYAQLTAARPRFSLSATARSDSNEATAGRVSPFFLASTAGPLDRDEEALSAAVSARARLDERWQLSAGVGRAARMPTVLERYSDRFPSSRFQIAAEFLGDPALEPEVSSQLDLGVAYRGADLDLSIDLFYRRIDDYITVAPDPSLPKRLPLSPPVVYRYVNGTRADFRGGEVALSQRLDEHWSWNGSVSWIRGEDRAFDEPAFGMPPLTARLQGRWRSRGDTFWLEAGVLWADRQDRAARARAERETPGYTVVDVAGGYRFSDAWRLRLGVTNLADEAYADHLNSLNPFTGERVAEPGRGFHAAVEARF